MNYASRLRIGSSVVAVILIVTGIVFAAKPPTKKEARVTQIIKEVNILASGEDPRPAVQNDEVKENSAVKTGDESRSELTFEDLTITRLGANTVFSFNKAGRSGHLESGSILLRVPKNSGGAEFRTRAVTVGITGTTVIFESTLLGNSKLYVLEGSARAGLIKYPKQVKNVAAGKMLNVKAGAVTLPEPEDVDLDQLTRTHPLIIDFPPLPSDNLIRTAIRNNPPPAPIAPPPGQGQPVAASTPVLPPVPRSTFPPAPPKPTQTPLIGINPSPKPTRTPNLDINNPSPKPTKPPKGALGTPLPTAKPTSTPKGTPRFNPTLPPKQMIGQPVQSGQASQSNIPKKRAVRRPTPTPTPTPKIN